MRIISFGWTWPAFAADKKTVTRRDWDAEYAVKFKRGDILQAYDRSPRYGGKKIGLLRLTQSPYLERTNIMPDEDYEAEGFAYLNANRHLLPKSMPYNVSRYGFEAWKALDEMMWVVRFVRME